MGGQTNSWMDKFQQSNIPCIGDTVREVSSTTRYDYDTNGGNGYLVSEESSNGNEFPWWILIAGGIALYLLKGRRA